MVCAWEFLNLWFVVKFKFYLKLDDEFSGWITTAVGRKTKISRCLFNFDGSCRQTASNIWEFIEKTLEKLWCLLKQAWKILSWNVNDVFRMIFEYFFSSPFPWLLLHHHSSWDINTVLLLASCFNFFLKPNEVFKSISRWFE